MKKLNREWGILRFCVNFFLVFFLFASCATSPKTDPALPEGEPNFSVLPPGASAYLWADVERARPLLEALSFEGMSGKDASQILDRTGMALLAVYSESAEQRFFLAGWGNYPNLRAGASMSFSRDWKKVKSETGNRYWHSEGLKLGIALGPKLAYVSDGDPFALGSGTDPSPPGFGEFRSTSVLSGWLTNPKEAINDYISAIGLPIEIPAEEFFFGAVRLPAGGDTAAGEFPDADQNGGLWELVMRIKTPSPSHARSFLSLFSIVRLFVAPLDSFTGSVSDTGAGGESTSSMNTSDIAALLFANVPVQEDEYLTLHTRALREERIALLFKMFQLYSNQ